jgi:Icc protein
LNSKSKTPSGLIADEESIRLLDVIDENKHQFILMHHHPANVEYFIDKHGLVNKDNFYQTLNQIKNLKAIGCGHVHNAIDLKVNTSEKSIPLFTCPATSIQFNRSISSVENSGKPAGYRVFKLHNDGLVISQVIFIR